MDIPTDFRRKMIMKLIEALKDSPSFCNISDSQLKEAVLNSEHQTFQQSKNREEYVCHINEKLKKIKQSALARYEPQSDERYTECTRMPNIKSSLEEDGNKIINGNIPSHVKISQVYSQETPHQISNASRKMETAFPSALESMQRSYGPEAGHMLDQGSKPTFSRPQTPKKPAYTSPGINSQSYPQYLGYQGYQQQGFYDTGVRNGYSAYHPRPQGYSSEYARPGMRYSVPRDMIEGQMADCDPAMDPRMINDHIDDKRMRRKYQKGDMFGGDTVDRLGYNSFDQKAHLHRYPPYGSTLKQDNFNGSTPNTELDDNASIDSSLFSDRNKKVQQPFNPNKMESISAFEYSYNIPGTGVNSINRSFVGNVNPSLLDQSGRKLKDEELFSRNAIDRESITANRQKTHQSDRGKLSQSFDEKKTDKLFKSLSEEFMKGTRKTQSNSAVDLNQYKSTGSSEEETSNFENDQKITQDSQIPEKLRTFLEKNNLSLCRVSDRDRWHNLLEDLHNRLAAAGSSSVAQPPFYELIKVQYTFSDYPFCNESDLAGYKKALLEEKCDSKRTSVEGKEDYLEFIDKALEAFSERHDGVDVNK